MSPSAPGLADNIASAEIYRASDRPEESSSVASLSGSERQAIIARGSKSFAFAAWLLPRGLRRHALLFYAFCRYADDQIDAAKDAKLALRQLKQEVRRCAAGLPSEVPEMNALRQLHDETGLPWLIIDYLLEGFTWDTEHRRYQDLDELSAYCVRVAGTVGVAMCWFMGVRDRQTFARAIDLGVAMQLTNIARDVAEDHAMGRQYLPLDDCGDLLNPGGSRDVLTDQEDRVRSTVARLCQAADGLYARAELGLTGLPVSARLAIRVAGRVYRQIGVLLSRRGYDVGGRRIFVDGAGKLGCALWALCRPSPKQLGKPPRRYRLSSDLGILSRFALATDGKRTAEALPAACELVVCGEGQ